jgi:hypothetical protein
MRACAWLGCRKNERSALSSDQLIEQRLGLFQIARVEAFGEPAVDRSEKLARRIPLALIAEETMLPAACKVASYED